MTNIRKLFLKLLAINLLLSMSMLSLDAHAQFNYEQPQQDNVVLSNLNINVYGQQTLNLKQMVQQRYGPLALRNKALKRIILKASAQSYQSSISLLINNSRVTAVHNLSYYEDQIILDLPTSSYGGGNIIDQGIQTIKLLVSGNVQIKRISLQLAPSYGNNHGNQILRAHNVSLGGYSNQAQRINLDQIIRTNGAHQKVVRQIKIVATGLTPRAIINITASGYGPIKNVHLGSYQGSVQTELIQVPSGIKISDIKLSGRGQIRINSIEVLVR